MNSIANAATYALVSSLRFPLRVTGSQLLDFEGTVIANVPRPRERCRRAADSDPAVTLANIATILNDARDTVTSNTKGNDPS